MNKSTPPTLAEKVDRRTAQVAGDGCWLWTGGVHHRGYGVTSFDGKWLLAHRAAYMAHVGEIPQGMFVCHRCDNPRCVRPSHLFLGSPSDNMTDKVAKGRQSRGESHATATTRSGKHAANVPRGDRHGATKVSESLRADIVEATRTYTQKRVGEMFGITQSRVSQIVRGSAQ